MKIFCGILAAGRGDRFLSKKTPKQLLPIRGSALFLFTLKKINDSGLFDKILLALQKENEKIFLDSIKADSDLTLNKNIVLTFGGKSRMDSILSILRSIEEDFKIESDDIFCLVDCNRPLIDKNLYEHVINAAIKYSISCPARNLVDGVGIVKNDFLTNIPDKSELQSIQTPEACNLKKLLQLIKKGEHHGKFGLCEVFLGAGINPKVIKGDYRTHKVTYPEDLVILEALIKNQKKI